MIYGCVGCSRGVRSAQRAKMGEHLRGLARAVYWEFPCQHSQNGEFDGVEVGNFGLQSTGPAPERSPATG